MFPSFINHFHKKGIEYIIAGLGNPGPKYHNTRHNVGFVSVDELAKKHGAEIQRLKFRSLTAEISLGSHKILLLKPQTFMNSSGEAVAEAARFYRIPPENILVIFDDISLPPGKLRVRRKGSDGGHNGIRSIITHLDSENFPRIKIGVGAKPHPDYDLAKWVLSTFSSAEQKPLREAITQSVDAAELIISGSIDEAMNRFN